MRFALLFANCPPPLNFYWVTNNALGRESLSTFLTIEALEEHPHP
jgi:hypothetical protein